jgi:hypothetical protein
MSRFCNLWRAGDHGQSERPRIRAADERYEFTTLHSITMILSSPAHALEAQFFSV